MGGDTTLPGVARRSLTRTFSSLDNVKRHRVVLVCGSSSLRATYEAFPTVTRRRLTRAVC